MFRAPNISEMKSTAEAEDVSSRNASTAGHLKLMTRLLKLGLERPWQKNANPKPTAMDLAAASSNVLAAGRRLRTL